MINIPKSLGIGTVHDFVGFVWFDAVGWGISIGIFTNFAIFSGEK